MTRVLDTFALAVRDPAMRRIAIAYVAFNVAEWATWVAILVYAYERGGTAASGLVAVVQLVPAALFAPAGAAIADRTSRSRILTFAYFAQATAMLATGTALAVDAPLPLTYALAAITATTITLTRPAQNGMLPSLAPDAETLTSANALLSAIENASIVAGPALAGAVLTAAGAGTVFVLMAAALVIGALLVTPLRATGPAGVATSERDDTAVRPLMRNGGALLVIALLALQQLQVGALDVLFVALGLAALNIGATGVGLLSSAVGVGGIIGALAAGAIIARRTPALWIAVGSVVWGLGLALVAPSPQVVLVFVVVIAAGAGRGLMDVAGRTLLQRVAPAGSLSRAFGALEALTMAALAGGAAVAPLLVDRYGPRGAIAAAGLVSPAVTLVVLRALLQVRARPPETRALALVRGTPLFAHLSEPALEQMANALVPVEAPAGTVIVREGEPGDHFYLIDKGRVAVTRSGTRVRELAPGGWFGELALLRNEPRSMTVMARDAVRLYALDRAHFLDACTTSAAGVPARRTGSPR